MLQDPLLKRLVTELINQHGCHTIILYGSRARGDHNLNSDYDLLGIRKSGEVLHDARIVENHYLDAFIYPESALDDPSRFLHLRGGRILIEQEDCGARLLSNLETLYQAGPPPWPEQERSSMRTWCEKMLRRIARDDLEGRYRRAWLLFDLLGVAFKLKGRWYEGPKQSLAWLKENDQALYALFDRALDPSASQSDLDALVRHIWSKP